MSKKYDINKNNFQEQIKPTKMKNKNIKQKVFLSKM